MIQPLQLLTEVGDVLVCQAAHAVELGGVSALGSVPVPPPIGAVPDSACRHQKPEPLHELSLEDLPASQRHPGRRECQRLAVVDAGVLRKGGA